MIVSESEIRKIVVNIRTGTACPYLRTTAPDVLCSVS
jgi:hypothetical protein